MQGLEVGRWDDRLDPDMLRKETIAVFKPAIRDGALRSQRNRRLVEGKVDYLYTSAALESAAPR